MESLQIHRSVCAKDCYDTCALQVTVAAGQVVAVTGDPGHPTTAGFVCEKVRRSAELVRPAGRVLQPLLRTGPKGTAAFRPCSWTEAMDQIAARLQEICRTYGPEAVLPYSYAGTVGVINRGSMDRRFFHRLGASHLARTICSTAGGEGYRHTVGALVGTEPEAMADARLIINWGLNARATNIHAVPYMQAARRRGATVVNIDCVPQGMDGMADLTLTPRPGTDGALALGLMYVMIADGLYDADYVAQWTVGFDELAQRVLAFPPERVEAITGVPAGQIWQLADLYATTHPSFIRVGAGMQHQTNGGQTVRNITCLTGLAGAWQHAGGGMLYANTELFPINRAALERPDLLASPRRTLNMNRLGEALTAVQPPVQALLVYSSNPAVVAPDQGRVLTGLARPDLFTVVHDLVLTDTAMYADVVLPATSQFESLDLYVSYWHPYVQVADAIVAPPGEAVSNTEVFRRLAAAMGFTEPCFQDSDEDLVRQALDDPQFRAAGITLESLRAAGHLRMAPPEQTARPFATGFPTPSGKLEFYSATLAARGHDPLPWYTPPGEGPEATPDLYARYPLSFITLSSRFLINSTFANIPAIAGREKQPLLLIHPDDAVVRGIADGATVRVWNDRGQCRLRAAVTGGIRPGVVAARGQWWNQHFRGGANVNQTTAQHLTDLGAGSTFNTNLVQVAPDAADP